MTIRSTTGLALRGALVLGAAFMLSGFAGPKPECIAPAAPGGGWDFTCRTVGRLLHELKIVDRPVQVVNMPGAVGAGTFWTGMVDYVGGKSAQEVADTIEASWPK